MTGNTALRMAHQHQCLPLLSTVVIASIRTLTDCKTSADTFAYERPHIGWISTRRFRFVELSATAQWRWSNWCML